MTTIDTFLHEKPRMFGLAYRMLGTGTEAEDVLQDAYLRLQSAEEVQNARAFLTRVVTNLCLDRLRSIQRKREEYVGTWLPEPIAPQAADGVDPDTLRFAFVKLLQELNPRERAVFLLREVFEHEYADVAEWLGESEGNCRQLLSRAKRKLEAGKPRYRTSSHELEDFLNAFQAAAEQPGDPVERLKARLARDVAVWSDGGGKVPAALNTVSGDDKVARMLLGLYQKGAAGAEWDVATLNGEPAVLVLRDGKIETAALLAIEGGRLVEAFFVRNPEKLTFCR